jgi:hypothetical protein
MEDLEYLVKATSSILNSQPDIQPMDTLQKSKIFPELHYIRNFRIIYGVFLGLLG